tara:strand:- start:131 stop:382 length:252 start_codon:yes stop_codon:yes gene_type:complete
MPSENSCGAVITKKSALTIKKKITWSFGDIVRVSRRLAANIDIKGFSLNRPIIVRPESLKKGFSKASAKKVFLIYSSLSNSEK